MSKSTRIPLWHPAYGAVLATMSLMIATMTFFLYGSSLFITPMAEDFGVALGTIQLREFTNGITAIVVLPFVNKMYQKFGFKWVTIFGLLCYTGSFIGYAMSPNVYVLIAFGLLQGVGNALAVLMPGSVMIMGWFQKGASIAMLLGNVPAILLSSVVMPWLVNMISAHGWRYSTIVCAIIVTIPAVTICLIFANPSPEAQGKHPFGWQAPKNDGKADTAAKAAAGPMTVSGVSLKNAKKSPMLYMFLFITITSTLAMNILRYASPLAIQSGFTEEMAGNALAMYNIASSVAMILSAFLVEKMGNKMYALVIGAINVIALLLLMYNGGNYMLFSIGLCACAFYSMQYMQSIAPRDIFGIMDFAGIFAILNIGANVINMIGASAFGYVYDFTGSYNAVLWVYAGFLILSMIFTVIIYKKKNTLTWEERVADLSEMG